MTKKINEYYEEYSANIHRGVYTLSERATEEYEKVRYKVANFIDVKIDEVIFTSGTTESINLVAKGWGEINLKKGDEAVVTVMEHHSNLVPWQELTKKIGVKLNYWLINTNGRLDLKDIKKLVNKNTRLLSITQVSNVTGVVNPIKEIVRSVKKINPKIVVVIDGAQAVAHMKVRPRELGVDFYAFSGHKMYGPTGVGVLWGKRERLEEMDPVKYGGGMIKEVTIKGSQWAEIPYRFEGGTGAIAEVIGLGSAIDYIERIGWKYIIEQENETLKYGLKELNKISDIKLLGPKDNENRVGIVSFNIKGIHAHDIASILDDNQVAVRGGHHCAMPLHESLGATGSVRVSLGLYNNKEDIDKLVISLKKVINIFNR